MNVISVKIFYLVICVKRGSRSKAKNECDKNCAPNQGKANKGGVSLSLCICSVMIEEEEEKEKTQTM